MSISTSSASGSTVTVAVEVWIRPLASVTGTRCTRCVPALVLQADVGVGTLHEEDCLVDAVLARTRPRTRISTFHFLGRGVAQVHVVEDAGEQVGLVAAHRAADLHDDVATLVGVLGQQERLDPLLERGHQRLGLVDLLAHELALVARRSRSASRAPS